MPAPVDDDVLADPCFWCRGTGVCLCANTEWYDGRAVTGTWWEAPCPWCGGSGWAAPGFIRMAGEDR